MTRVVWLCRHGERRDDVDAAWARTAERPDDPPLTERGRWQAERVGERLANADVDAIYASPFLRAVETADVVARRLELPVYLEHGLCEHLNPEWFETEPVTLTRKELARRFETVDLDHWPLVRPKFPETADEAAERSAKTARKLLASGPESLLLVGHGLTVDGVTAGFTGREGLPTPYCGLTQLVCHPWGWDTDLVADTAHLDG